MDWLSEWLEPEYSEIEEGEIITETAEKFFNIPFPRYKTYLQVVLSSTKQLEQPHHPSDSLLFHILQKQLHILYAAEEQCTQIISLLLSTGTIRLRDLIRILEPTGIHKPLNRSMCPFHLIENSPSGKFD
jgi:hypothetical protein